MNTPNLSDEGLRELARLTEIECSSREEACEAIFSALKQVRRETREACAVVAEDCDCGYSHTMCEECCHACCGQSLAIGIRVLEGR